jgi:16S rRNA processing protein RimM
MVVMGRVELPWGVQGWLRVRPFCTAPETLLEHRRWWLRGPGVTAWNERTLIGGRRHADSLLVQLAGVDNREVALRFKGFDVAVPRTELPPARRGEIYAADLVGLDVVNREGIALGRVVEVADYGAHPLLRVRGEGEGALGERLIPYVPVYVTSVDVEAGRIEVDWGEDY